MALNPREWTMQIFMARHFFKFCIITISTVAVGAQAAVLRFNPTPGDNTGGIIFDGPVEATIVQSTAGMDIIIPGVTFTLECQGDPSDSCQVSVDSTAVVNSPSADNDNDSDAGSDANTDSQDCSGLSGFGTQYAGACDNTSQDGSQSPTGSTDGDQAEDPNSGFEVDKGDGTVGGDQPQSSGWGLKPSTGTGDAAERVDFPASDRVDYISSPDVGSGGAEQGGNTFAVALGLKTVTVMPLTMSSKPVTGGVGYFEPSSSPSGSDFAMWVSNSRDGEALPGCSVYGGFDGKLRISTEVGGAGCLLQAGTTYYLNAAACVRGDPSDYACRKGAQTGYEGGNVLLSGDW